MQMNSDTFIKVMHPLILSHVECWRQVQFHHRLHRPDLIMQTGTDTTSHIYSFRK